MNETENLIMSKLSKTYFKRKNKGKYPKVSVPAIMLRVVQVLTMLHFPTNLFRRHNNFDTPKCNHKSFYIMVCVFFEY